MSHEIPAELATILAQLEMVSTAPTSALNASGGGNDDAGPSGSAHSPADHYRSRLVNITTGLQRRLDASEAQGDHHEREREQRKADAWATNARARVLVDATADLAALTGRTGDAPRAHTATLDEPGAMQTEVLEHGAGHPVDVVAARYRLTPFMVRRMRLRAGRDAESGDLIVGERVQAGERRRARARELAGKGMPTRQIALMLGCHRTQVVRDLKPAG